MNSQAIIVLLVVLMAAYIFKSAIWISINSGNISEINEQIFRRYKKCYILFLFLIFFYLFFAHHSMYNQC